MTAPSMFLNLTCCFYLFFYLRSPHADRLWRENSNGILYIDLFLFFKKYNYYDYFFPMVASGHLSVGTSRIFRERKKVCVCGPLLPVTADDEAAGTWNAVLHTDTHTLANTYA